MERGVSVDRREASDGEILPKPNDSERTTRCDDEVASIVAKWHTSEDREGGVQLQSVSKKDSPDHVY